MRCWIRVILPIVALALIAASSSLAEPLPADPALVSGQLDNGLRYVVRQHSIPAGRATVWVHIHSGSMNETDRQRGIAHYLEHMAFNGSTHFPPGQLVPFFQSLGMTFGRDQNAYTSYDQTTYQLSLPDTKPETLGKGMTYFADVVGGLLLLPAEVDNERQIILEERRRGLSGQQRARDYVNERMYPGSLFGFRSPIGTAQTIGSVNPQDFKDYWGKWYSASNATLMVVADCDPQGVVAVIKDKFGALPARPRPTPQDMNIRPYERSFAIVTSDPEIRQASLRMVVRLEPAHGPVTTIERWRENLVQDIGDSIMNHRMRERGMEGRENYLNANVSSGDEVGVLHAAEVSATARPEKWRAAMESVIANVVQARAFGFTQKELDRVRKDMISGAEWAINTEKSAPASAFMQRINASVSSGNTFMTASQRLELLKAHLDSISVEEVSKAFAAEYEPKNVAFVAILPSSAKMPTESELLEIGNKALSISPGERQEKPKTDDDADIAQLLPELPRPGAIAEQNDHAATGVWTGRLANNVLVHHKFMDQRKDSVSVSISLLGGPLLETADNRGITQAAQQAWARAATEHYTSAQIREFMNGKKVNVGGGGFGGMRGRGGGRRGGGGFGGGGQDSISLSINGAPAELETGFQLAYLLLTEPKIEEQGFTQYQTRTRTALQEEVRNPGALGARTAALAPYPDNDVRLHPLTPEMVDKLSLSSAQAWLDKLIAESPIEVTIIGDLPKEKAIDLATKYLGALPARPRVEPALFADLRKVARPAGPRVIEKTVDTETDEAYVQCAFYGADESNRADARALGMASRILSTRMVKEVREEAQLVYSIGASSRSGSTYPGFGVFSAGAPTDPKKADALVEKITSMFDAFAKTGPGDDEIDVARKQYANTYEEQLKDPSFWSERLSRIAFRGITLDEIADEADAYQRMTAQEVKDVFAKYYSRPNSIVVVVKPSGNHPTTRTASSGDGQGPGGAGGD